MRCCSRMMMLYLNAFYKLNGLAMNTGEMGEDIAM